MKRLALILSVGLALAALTIGAAHAQAPEAGALMNLQRQAMAPLVALDGTWRGKVKIYLPDGSTRELLQTERVGSMLDGTVKLVEGRGHGPGDRVEFNAFAVISYVPATQRYVFNSWAQGMKGEFAFEPLADGFAWTIKYGSTSIRHTATVKGDRWTEVGVRMEDGKPPVRLVEMDLQRVGTTSWPEAGAVPLK